MNDRMPNPSLTVVHWVRTPGYIKTGLAEPVCGIADKVTSFISVNLPSLEAKVTCEHCLYWLWDQRQPARKMDIDQRITHTTFNNRSLSANDTELAIERGVRQGITKLAEDFLCSEAVDRKIQLMVSEALESTLQMHEVRRNLVDIHKIADDELEAEYEGSEQQSDDDEVRHEDMKTAVRAVLNERGLSGVGVGTQVVNVNAEIDLEAFKETVKEAMAEYDEETLENYNEEETALMQKAVASVLVSDQSQDLFKKLVKVAIDEGRAAETELELEFNQRMLQRMLRPYAPLVTLSEPTEPLVHQRKLYSTEGICGAKDGAYSPFTRQITCPECKRLNLQ